MIWNDYSYYVKKKLVGWMIYEKEDIFQTNHFPKC